MAWRSLLSGERSCSEGRLWAARATQSQMLTALCRMLIKTTDYLEHFARFKRKENVEAVERLLSAHKELAKFERAQLGAYISNKLCGSIIDLSRIIML